MGATTTNLSMLEKMRGGHHARAWQEFFHAYAPMLAAFAKRLGLSDADAADAVQETLIAVCTAFRQMAEPFDRSQGRFKSWLHGVAQHKVRSLQRRRAREQAALPDHPVQEAGLAAGEAETEHVFEIEWQRNLLDRALAQVRREVDPAVYQAFELYGLHNQKPDQVARLLGVTRNAVYISKTRVLKRVRAVMAELIAEAG